MAEPAAAADPAASARFRLRKTVDHIFEGAGMLCQLPACLPVLGGILLPGFAIRLRQKKQKMGQRMHPQVAGLRGDCRIILLDKGVNLSGILGIMEGFFRNFSGFGNAAPAVEIGIHGLFAHGCPLGAQGNAVGHRHILADPAFRVAQALQQLPAVQLVAGAGIAVVVQENSSCQRFPTDTLFLRRTQTQSLFSAVRIHVPASGAGQLGIVLFQQRQQPRVHIRRNPVVAVHEADIISRGRVQPGVPGTAEAAVFLVDHPDSLVPGGILVTDASGIILRTVIHNDDFQVGFRLGKNGIQASCHIRLYIINGHDYADQSILFHTGSCWESWR